MPESLYDPLDGDPKVAAAKIRRFADAVENGELRLTHLEVGLRAEDGYTTASLEVRAFKAKKGRDA